MDVPEITEARKLRVEAGDIIVLRVPYLISDNVRARMRDLAREAFSPAKVVILDGGVTLDVLAAEERQPASVGL
jgi:hypothetical protein